MAVIKQPSSARTAVTATGLSTLAAGTYVVSNTVNNTTNQPKDLLVELAVTPGTVSGNKMVMLYAQASLDGTNFETGPTSGTTATDEPNLKYLGNVPVNSNSTPQMDIFSVSAAYGYVLPPYVRFVVKNDSGAALTAGALYVSEISNTLV